jgi:hypothetical protein
MGAHLVRCLVVSMDMLPADAKVNDCELDVGWLGILCIASIQVK